MKDEKAEVKVEKKSKDSDVIASISRRLSKVVKFLEEIHGADIDGDNRVGSVMTKLLVCIVSCFTVLSIAYASDNIDSKSLGTGTYSLDRAEVNTGLITLTVDAISADSVTQTGSADGNATRSIVRAGIAAGDLALGTNSLGVIVPDNAVVIGGYLDITTGLTGTGVLSTVALQLNGSADILAAVTVTNAAGLNATGVHAIIPVGTAATAVKMTGERTLNIVVGVEALNAGVGTVILEYDEIAN